MSETLDDAVLVEACDRFLSDRHCTLWGSAFSIIETTGRREASEWLAEQIRGVLAIVEPEQRCPSVSGAREQTRPPMIAAWMYS